MDRFGFISLVIALVCWIVLAVIGIVILATGSAGADSTYVGVWLIIIAVVGMLWLVAPSIRR